MNFCKRYIGNKDFYKEVIRLIVPMIIQQGISNFVSLLDNVMVGSLGTEPMSGVAIVNQLIFIYNLALFGGLSGMSIFGAQFVGKNDVSGHRYTFRAKMVFGVFLTVAAVAVFLTKGDKLVLLFLENEVNKAEDITLTLGYAADYMKIAVWGLLPFMVVQAYTGSLRELGETFIPMTSSVVSIFVNLLFNWLLIFGKLGFPKMGVAGAALATLIARFTEMCVILIASHRNKKRFSFLCGAYSSPRVPLALVRQILITGSPLFLNEILWSLGNTFISQNYSTRGLEVVAAYNITGTVWQIFTILMFSLANVVSIMVGQKLGAGEIEEAKDVDRKLLFLSIASHIVLGAVLVLASSFIPLIYNVEPEVRALATSFLRVEGFVLPLQCLVHVIYFTIRSGGRTFITFLFDSVYTWCVPAVLSFFLCTHTALDIVTVYLLVQVADICKIMIGIPILCSGTWAKRIIKDEN